MKEFEWKVTSDYPVRYVARKLFPACVELEESQHANPMRFEVGYYSHEIQNNDYPHLTDGIYGEIVTRRSEKKSRHVIGYRIEVSAYLPNALRLQHHWSENTETFSQAKSQMELLLRTAYEWVENILEQTKGLEHTIRWKRTEQGFELRSIGSRLFLHKYCSWILRDSHQCSEQLKQQCVVALQEELCLYQECYEEGCQKGFQEHPAFISIKQDIDEMETALKKYKKFRQLTLF